MTERRCALLVALLLLVLASGPASAAEPKPGDVTSVRRGVVYVHLGTLDGVKLGDVLQVKGRDVKLEVTAVGESQLSAKVVGQGTISGRDSVVPPVREEAAEGAQRRPLKELPPAPHLTDGDVQTTVELIEATPIAPVKFKGREGEGGPREEELTVSGDVTVLYLGILDTSPQQRSDMSLHQVRVRSRLDVDHIAGVPFSYAHDLGFRGDFGPNLDVRPGSRSRPYYEIRRLTLAYGTYGDGFYVRGGRMPLLLPGEGGLLDGAELSVGVGEGVTLGMFGGLSPDLLDTGVSADVGRFGVTADWAMDTGPVWVRAGLSVTGSTFQGSLDRKSLAVSTSATMGRLWSLYGDVTIDLFAGFNPMDRPVVDLSSAFAGFRIQPLEWLTVDTHYDFYRDVVTRELEALLPDMTLVSPATEPRQTAWLQVSFDPLPMLTVSQAAGVGFDNDASDALILRSRLVLRNLPVIRTGVHLGYVFDQTEGTRVQMGTVTFVQPIVDEVQLTAGYGFTTTLLRYFDERYDEHRVEGGVDLWFGHGFYGSALTDVALDDTAGTVVTVMGYGGWRF